MELRSLLFLLIFCVSRSYGCFKYSCNSNQCNVNPKYGESLAAEQECRSILNVVYTTEPVCSIRGERWDKDKIDEVCVNTKTMNKEKECTLNCPSNHCNNPVEHFNTLTRQLELHILNKDGQLKTLMDNKVKKCLDDLKDRLEKVYNAVTTTSTSTSTSTTTSTTETSTIATTSTTMAPETTPEIDINAIVRPQLQAVIDYEYPPNFAEAKMLTDERNRSSSMVSIFSVALFYCIFM